MALAFLVAPAAAAQQAHISHAAPTAKELKAQATADFNAVIATESNKYGTLPAQWSFGDRLIVNDTVYHAGATLNTTTGLNYYGLTYRHDFMAPPAAAARPRHRCDDRLARCGDQAVGGRQLR